MIQSEFSKWPQIKDAVQRGLIAILPFGAHEQHGPHCPLNTDTVLASGLARRLAEAIDGMLLPGIPYGETWNNEGFPGTVSISFETVQAILRDLARSLKHNGVRALIVVNGHFGNHAPLELACRRIQNNDHLPVLLIDYPGLERIATEVCESRPAAPGFYHADEVETSLMLLLQPESVQMDLAAPEYPQFPKTFGAEPIPLDQFCKSGVFGDPRSASKEKGERILNGLIQESLNLITAFLSELPHEEH